MWDADYADDLVFLTNTPDLAGFFAAEPKAASKWDCFLRKLRKNRI